MVRRRFFAVSNVGLGLMVISGVLGALTSRADSPLLSGERSPTVKQSDRKLQRAEDATARCRKILGLPEAMPLPVSAALVTLEEDNTPYLSDQLVSRPLWRVSLGPWHLKLDSAPPGPTERYARTIDVLLDPVDGRLLKLQSRWPEGEPPMLPTVDATRGTMQLNSYGRTTYHGFPSEPPKVTFLRALDIINREGGAPRIAKQIVAQYVMWSRMGEEPRAVWAVMLRGVPPIKPPSGVCKDFLDQYCHIVDAETGTWLQAVNLPGLDRSASDEE